MADLGITTDQVPDLLGSVMDSFNKTQGIALADLQDTTRSQEQIQESASAYNAVVGQTANDTAAIVQKAQKARAMADGGLDQVMELMFKQSFDSDYTAAGRQQTLGLIDLKANTAAQLHNANVRGIEAGLATRKAARAEDMFNANSTLLTLNTRVQTLGTLSQGVAASEALRVASLSSADISTIDKALGSPDLIQNEKTMIGGFEYSKTELLETRQNLKTREFLSSLPIDMASPEASAALEKIQEGIMQTMTSQQLIDIRTNGGFMPDGTQADPKMLTAMINDKSASEMQAVGDSLAESLSKQQYPRVLTEADRMVRQFTQNSKPGDPLYAEAQQFGLDIAAIIQAEGVASKTPGGMLVLQKSVVEAQTNFAAKIEAEAMRQAGGDVELSGIIKSQLYGAPPDPRQVTDYVASQFREGKAFGRVLPAAESQQLQTEIGVQLKAVIQENTGYGEKPSAADMKILREEAARRGMETFRQSQALRAANLIPKLALSTRKDNPLVIAGFNSASYAQLEAQATQLTEENLLRGTDLPPKTFDEIKAGNYEALGLSAAQAEDLMARRNFMSMQMEYDLIESAAPGTASAYVDWLAQNQGQLYEQVLSQPDVAGSSTLIRDAFEEKAQTYVQLLSSARETATGRASQVIKESMTKAYEPKRMFSIAFKLIDSVEDDQKNEVLNKIVIPTINKGTELKMNQDEIGRLVYDALVTGIEGEPGVSRSASRVLRSLPAVMAQYTTLVDNVFADDRVGHDRLKSMLDGTDTTTSSRAQDMRARQVFGFPGEHSNSSYFGADQSYLNGDTMSRSARSLIENPGGADAVVKAIEAARSGGN